MKQRHLVVMLKQPRPGSVKTRLAADIGTVPACWWFRHQVRALLRRVRDPRWRLVLAVSPDTALPARDWPSDLPRIAQGRGDLGARMGRILRTMPSGPTCIIGGDIPDVQPLHIARAFDRLAGADAVLGPTPDGGYWLIGLQRGRAVPAGIFDGVRWSTDTARSDTLATLSGLRVATADLLHDIDRASDLERPPVS